MKSITIGLTVKNSLAKVIFPKPTSKEEVP